jgi:hypothetical protein
MKKMKILTMITLMGALLGGCAATASQAERIDKEAAKAAAIAEAGVDASEVTVTSLELDKENGREYYEVDFVVDGAEYEYEIDALTGEIITFEVEKRGTPQVIQMTPAS